MKTEKDLRIEFRTETGNDAEKLNSLNEVIDFSNDYVSWLEEKVLKQEELILSIIGKEKG
jgi:hypothetical protein